MIRKRPQASATLALYGLMVACSSEPTWDPGQMGSGGPDDTSGVQPGPGSPVPDPNAPTGPGTQPGVSPTTTGDSPTPSQPVIPDGGPIPLKLDGTPTLGQLNRLTHSQWANTVQALLALQSTPEAAETFAPDAVVGTFSNNEKYLSPSQTLISDYERAVENLVKGLTEQQLAQIYSGSDAEGFIKAFGRRAYRRPLSDQEVAKYVDVYTVGAELPSSGSAFFKGAGLVIQAMLQSPFFIYRTELGTPGQPLDAYQIAAKLSFALWNVGPSDALLDAAQSGKLDSPEGIAAEAQTMLEDPRAVEVMRRFHGETLQFSRFGNIHKEQSIVPEFKDSMAESAREAAYLFFDRIFTEDLGLKDIFTSTVGFVNNDLAALYDVAAPGSGFTGVDLGAERPGYFSQVPYLLLHSVNYVPDPVHRGVDLGLRMLCAKVDSPPFVPPPPPTPKPDQSNREALTLLTSAPACASCHGPYINPLGFAFENFDGLGRFRETDNGKPVDASGEYPFTEGKKSWNTSAELMTLLTQSEQAHDCYAANLTQFMLGRELATDDLSHIKALSAVSKSDASLKDLILELVKSPAFRINGGGNQ